MNEPKYPLEPDLSQFVDDLKSLTPRSELIEINSQRGETASAESFVVRKQVSEAVSAPINARTNSGWLQTVAAAWTLGLAAGLLVSALWHRWPVLTQGSSSQDLISSSHNAALLSGIIDAQSNEYLPDSYASDAKSLNAVSPTSPHSLNAADRTPYYNAQGSWRISNSHILNPMTPWNALSYGFQTSASLSLLNNHKNQDLDSHEQNNAPTPSTLQLPVEQFPADGGDSILKPSQQHQLLKSLLEKEGVVSTQQALYCQFI